MYDAKKLNKLCHITNTVNTFARAPSIPSFSSVLASGSEGLPCSYQLHIVHTAIHTVWLFKMKLLKLFQPAMYNCHGLRLDDHRALSVCQGNICNVRLGLSVLQGYVYFLSPEQGCPGYRADLLSLIRLVHVTVQICLVLSRLVQVTGVDLLGSEQACPGYRADLLGSEQACPGYRGRFVWF